MSVALKVTAEQLDAARAHSLTWRERERVLHQAGLYPGKHEFPEQWAVWQSESRRMVLAGGWRSSKTFTAIGKALPEIAWGFNRRGWILGPSYANAEYAALELYRLTQERLGLPLRIDRNEHRWWATGPLGVSTVEWKSAEHPTSLQTVPINWLIVTETADVPEYIWTDYLQGRLFQFAPWAILEGTFAGLNWFLDKWQEGSAENAEGWQSFSLPTWSNPYLDIQYVESLKAGMDQAVVDEKLGAKPRSPVGLVFDKFSHKLHVRPDMIYQAGEPVYLWVDPAPVSPYSVLAAHVVRDDVHVFDEVYEERISTEEVLAGRGKPFYDRKGLEVQHVPLTSRPWWKDVRGGAVDVRAVQDRRDWARHGIHLSAQSVERSEGIKRLNDFLWDQRLGRPRLFIHPRCRGVIAEFSQFRHGVRRDPMGDTLSRSFKGADHALNAAWYGLVGKFGLSVRVGRNSYYRRDYFGTD